MLLRLLIILSIGWFIYTLYRRLTGAKRRTGGGKNPFQRSPGKSRFDGKAVDADFEELDDKKGGA